MLPPQAMARTEPTSGTASASLARSVRRFSRSGPMKALVTRSEAMRPSALPGSKLRMITTAPPRSRVWRA